MDPISQAAVGAAASLSKSKTNTLKQAIVIGALAGMAPDLDVLIRSSNDPLLELEFHRHFTHSLFFIPFGAALCAIVFYYLFRKRWNLSFGIIYLWCFLGYGSHGLLDACTTYGTQLLWPFSDYRVAWNTISVVDPLLTIPLIACILLALTQRSLSWHRLGVIWLGCYLSAGWMQSQRAEAIGQRLASERGHSPVSLEAKPSFANILLWKIVYEHDGKYYVDAVRPGFNKNKTWQGESIHKFNLDRDFPWLRPNGSSPPTQQAKDIQRFEHFSSGYIGIDPEDSNSIVDIRYSMLPHQIAPMWGITIDRNKKAQDHVDYFVRREPPEAAIQTLWSMLLH